MPAILENSAVAIGLEKVSFYSNPKESHVKECLNYHTIALISHASKVMLKILHFLCLHGPGSVHTSGRETVLTHPRESPN